MELKAVNEYKAPEYSTCEESKNKVLRLIMSCKKISIGVLAMFLLCSSSMAAVPPSLPVNDEIGGCIRTPSIEDVSLTYYSVSIVITAIVYLLYVIMCTIIFNSKINRNQDEEEKNKKRKKRNKLLLIGGIVAFVIPLLAVGVAAILYFLL